jgi:hypothetical protein
VTKDKGNIKDSEIQEITGTENARDIEARIDEDPQVIPYIKGIKLMSEREATECAEHGEVLRWSTDSEPEQTNDIPDQTTPQSDTTGSTPDMFKSPQIVQDRVPGSIVEDSTRTEQTEVQKTKAPRKYKGWVYIPETEVQDNGEGIKDNLPVASLNKDNEETSLTLEKIQDLKEGPKEEGAVGKIVAKVFDGVEYRGKVDSFRQVRQRFYYHITYTDGDEEDMSQIELRDAYLGPWRG